MITYTYAFRARESRVVNVFLNDILRNYVSDFYTNRLTLITILVQKCLAGTDDVTDGNDALSRTYSDVVRTLAR